MAVKDMVLYFVWSEVEKKSYGEFLNLDCAVRHLGTTMMRQAVKEYAKYLYENRHKMTKEDYLYYGKLYLDDYYTGNFTLRRKVWDDHAQGYVEFDNEYEFDVKQHIDHKKIVEQFVNIAIKVVGAPGR